MSTLVRALRAAALLSFASFTVASVGCSSDAQVGDDEEEEEGAGVGEDAISQAAAGPVEFRDACRAGTSITIAAVGDVLLHAPLQRQAYASPEGHHSLWKGVEGMLERADLTYGNFEGPAAEGTTTGGSARDPGKVFDNSVYSSYPQFNYHPSLIGALKESGFDVVSTANNHALDRRSIGADRTIANMERDGLPFTGTRRADGTGNWYTTVEAKGIKVAFVACTFSTNGIPDTKKQVLHCYEGGRQSGPANPELISTIQALKQRPNVDAIIVTPHWGVEYNHVPEQSEQNLAKAMLNAGALAVFGGHPHVVQGMEKHVTPDGREGFVIYSLGNFVSGQSGTAKRSSLILYLGLTKGSDGKVTINGVRHLPLMMNPSPWSAVPATGVSLELTTKILGRWNRMEPAEELKTNPQCATAR